MRVSFIEILVVLAVIFVVFGASRIPQIGESLGRTIKNIRSKSDSSEPVAAAKKSGTS